jgi:hypothetical protein
LATLRPVSCLNVTRLCENARKPASFWRYLAGTAQASQEDYA